MSMIRIISEYRAQVKKKGYLPKEILLTKSAAGELWEELESMRMRTVPTGRPPLREPPLMKFVDGGRIFDMPLRIEPGIHFSVHITQGESI